MALDALLSLIKNNPPPDGWRASQLSMRTRKSNSCPIAWAVCCADKNYCGLPLNGRAASGEFDSMLGLTVDERVNIVTAADGFATTPEELNVKALLWEACDVPSVPSEYKPEDAF